MSASNQGPGGVRNLRAMFENRATDPSTSPPSRGRSPNGSVSSTQDRPLSKVRASFVAVEKVGEEAQPPPTPRKLSDVMMDGTNERTMTDDQGLGTILKGSPFLDEGAFPSAPKQESKSNGVGDRAAAMLKKMQGNKEPSLKSDSVEPTPKPKATKLDISRPQREATKEATSTSTDTNKTPTEPKGPVVKPRGGVSKIQGVMASAARAKEAREAAAKEEKQKEATIKPAGSKDPENSSKPPRTSAAHDIKLKGGVSKIQGVMDSANRAKEARSSNDTPSVAKSQTPKDTAKLPTATKPPRSSLPARRLPSAATASTASSVAKTDDTKPAEPKAAEKKPARLPSKVANVTATSSLAKKSSRASLNPNENSKPKPVTRPADEGFLARMMRPTASSAQKAHDKAPAQSPPRSKQTNGKTLTTKPSRKSLGNGDENKENHEDEPAAPAVQPEPEQGIKTPEPQQAEADPTST